MVIGIYERVSSVKQDTAAQHGELAVWAKQQEAKGERIVWYATQRQINAQARLSKARSGHQSRKDKASRRLAVGSTWADNGRFDDLS
jgi:hypothetical protein